MQFVAVRRFSSFNNRLLQRTLTTRVIQRLVWPKNKVKIEDQKSAIKMWSTYLTSMKCDTTRKLKEYQDVVMQKIQLKDSVKFSNDMVAGGINQWYFHNEEAQSIKTPTLLIHGYAASSLAYCRTFPGLTSEIRDLYAIDLPAFGLSPTSDLGIGNGEKLEDVKIKFVNDDKTAFKVLRDNSGKIEENTNVIRNLEKFYVDRIEDWRLANKLEKINLVGHSFGGYVSYKYSLKYPECVEKLCLVSPLGMERNMYSMNNKFETEKEYQVNQEDPSSTFYTNGRSVPNFLFKNQLNILRWLGPIGSKFVLNYINASSYGKVPIPEFKDYMYELLYGKGSMATETISIFTTLFTKGLLAKDPIMDSIDKLKVKKVMLMYGDHDWMNSYAGYKMVEGLNDLRAGTTKNSSEKARYLEVPDAGHNLFLDNPNYFNAALLKFLSK